jgi:outer membrane receptor for ferrienterochelin and colicins
MQTYNKKIFHDKQSLFLLTSALSFIIAFILIMTVDNACAAEQTNNKHSNLTGLDIEQLMKVEIATVFGASRFEQTVLEAPSSISIVTASDIRQYGYRTMADILRSVRGFYITYDRNYDYMGVRGFGRPGDYNSRVLLLVDGHRINDNIYGSASIGTDFVLDVDLIERVEIVRGPGSSLYGTNAFFAIINVITRDGRNIKGMEVSGEGASFGTYKGRMTYGNQYKNGINMILSASAYDSKGQSLYYKEFDTPDQNNGRADGCDYDKYKSYFGKISLNDIVVEGAFVTREKGIPTGAWGTLFNESGNKTTDNLGYIDVKYERSFENEFDVMTRIHYNRYKYEGTYISPPVNKDSALGEWLGGELKLGKTFFEKHHLIFGMEYQDNLKQNQKSFYINPYSSALDDKRTSTNWGVYMQDEFTILENLVLNAGIRHDHYQTFGGTTNPRIGLIYKPFEMASIKLLYGEAFRAPNAYEYYYHDGNVTSKSNRNLSPETIRTFELVYEQYFQNQLRLSASGFYYRIKDLISQQIDPADGLLVFNNIEEVEAKGLEFELEQKWENGFEGHISYTFQETKNIDTGTLLSNSPKHLGKMNMIYPLITKKLFAGLELQYTGRRKTISNNDAASFLTENLTLFSKDLYKGLEASLSIYNIFDTIYYDPGGTEHIQDRLEQNGRSFRLKFTYRF